MLEKIRTSKTKKLGAGPTWPLPYRTEIRRKSAKALSDSRLQPTFESEYEKKIQTMKDEVKQLRKTSLAVVNDNAAKEKEEGRKERIATPKESESSIPQVRDSINYYLSKIKKFTLLTAEEERTLAEKVTKGDSRARQRMIESNLRLVVNMARRYISKGFPFEDLIEEGNVGLIMAVERFRPSKGCRFSTYATYWIKQSIERAIANKANVVRLPVHVSNDLYRIMKVTRDLKMTLHREPTLIEISEKTGFTGRYVKKLDTIYRKSCSLETVLPDGSDQTLLDKLEDDRFPAPIEKIEHTDRADKIKGWLLELDDNERAIIKLRFGLDDDEPRTLEEIGCSFGVTRERVRQIESRALGKLREAVTRSDIQSLEGI
jgi:RNA polymerase primary sigma factor